jgi:hypothetical protein
LVDPNRILKVLEKKQLRAFGLLKYLVMLLLLRLGATLTLAPERVPTCGMPSLDQDVLRTMTAGKRADKLEQDVDKKMNKMALNFYISVSSVIT